MTHQSHYSKIQPGRSETMEPSEPALRQRPPVKGHWLQVPPARRLIFDLMLFAGKIPSQAIARHSNVQRLLDARNNSDVRISWSLLFMKAYAILSAKYPVLRQTYMRWPWPHFYEHPTTVARMAISRKHEGHDRLFFSRMYEVETYSLTELQEKLHTFQHAPIKETLVFQQQVTVSRMPMLMRRAIWRLGLYVSGIVRSHIFGTFGITTISGHGAISMHPPSLNTTTLTYSPIDKSGDVRLGLVYDHRVMDGSTASNFLTELVEILNGPIADELIALNTSQNQIPTPKHTAHKTTSKT